MGGGCFPAGIKTSKIMFWLALALLFALLAAFFIALGFVFTAKAIDSPLSIALSLTHIPFVMAANGLPISPGGLGVGESVAFVAFSKSGYAKGAELMLIVRVCLLIIRLPGIGFYLMFGRIKKDSDDSHDLSRR